MMNTEAFSIRVPDDYPVLCTAVTEDVDVLITGDKDFNDVDVEKPLHPNSSGAAEVSLCPGLVHG